MVLPAKAIIGALVLALYCLAGFIVYRHLIPRLAPTAGRLASAMLLAQILAIGGAFLVNPSSSFEAWLWNLNEEWNIQATLASTQGALVGAIALVAAWLARKWPLWQRLYLLGLGLVFLFIARDEYFVEHEFVIGWVRNIAILGMVLAAATLVVAWRSPRQNRIWHFCLLMGLATSAAGGLLIETQCGDASLLPIISCSDHFLLEEPLEFLGVWLALVAVLGHISQLSPSLRIQRALFLIPGLWLLLLIQSNAVHSVARYAGGSDTARIVFEGGYQLRGYLMENNEKHIGLFLSPGRWDFLGQGLDDLGYSIHVVDQVSGESIISRDQVAHRRNFLLTPGYVPVYRQWVEMGRPDAVEDNRAYWIVLTLWRDEAGEFRPLKITSSDHQLLGDTQVVLSEKVWRDRTPAATRDPLAIFDNGFALDAWQAPESIRAGEPLTITFSWRSEADGHEDHAQFLHLGHAESGEWWVYDQAPLGDRLPTRLWYSGLADSATWNVPLPADLAPGRYTVFSGLYRTRDKERVPASDADGDYFLDARVPLGSLVIE